MALILPEINGSSGVWGNILNDALNDLDTRVTNNTGNTSANTTAISNLTGRVNGHDTAIATHTNDISNLTSTTNTHTTQINSNANAITTLDQRVDTIEEGAGSGSSSGGLTLCTSTNRPPIEVGQICLETDTGYLYYVGTASGTPTRFPWPGTYVGKARQTTAQTITSGSAGTAINLQTEDFDRLGGFSGGSRYTVTVRGCYEFTGGVAFATDTTSHRSVTWAVNGTIHNATRVTLPPDTGAVPTIVPARTCVFSLAVGDYVELRGHHNTGSDLSTDVGSVSHQSNMAIKWVSSYN